MNVINELKTRPIYANNKKNNFDYDHSFNPAIIEDLNNQAIHCVQSGLIDFLEFSVKNPFYENQKILLLPKELDGFIPKTWKIKSAFYDYSCHLKTGQKKFLLLHAELNPLAYNFIKQKMYLLKNSFNNYEKIFICFTDDKKYSHWHTNTEEISNYKIIASITNNLKNYEFITHTDIKQNFDFTSFDFFDLDETTLFRPQHELIFSLLSKGASLINEPNKNIDILSHKISIYHSINLYPDSEKRFELNELILLDKTLKSSKSKFQTYLYSYCLNLINNR